MCSPRIVPANWIKTTSVYRDAASYAAVVVTGVGGVALEVPANSNDLMGDTFMKIAIASQGSDLTSMVDPRFGRASYFILYDTEMDSWNVIDNSPNTEIAHGAGIQTAQRVIDIGADTVVSGNFGPKAADVLDAAGIVTMVWSRGTVADAIELVRNNRLPTQA
jgi:predicted Fe-Mo cluster-binding NifX family protein